VKEWGLLAKLVNSEANARYLQRIAGDLEWLLLPFLTLFFSLTRLPTYLSKLFTLVIASQIQLIVCYLNLYPPNLFNNHPHFNFTPL